MQPLPPYRIIAIVFGFLLHSLMAVVATAPTALASQSATMAEDSGKWRRDPFGGNFKKVDALPTAKGIRLKNGLGYAPLEQEQNREINLQGIMRADTSFHALINGRVVKAGDRVGNNVVKHISRYQVTVINDKKEKMVYDIYQGIIH